MPKAPIERKKADLESDIVDELEANDDIEPLEEELDIIAEIGEMEPDIAQRADEDEFDFQPQKSNAKKLKENAKKSNPREYMEDMIEDEDLD
jgi:DNA-directed RNA polymerase subunit beta